MERDRPNSICNRSIHPDHPEGCFHTVMCVVFQGGCGPAESGFFGLVCWFCTRVDEVKYIDVTVLCQRWSQLRSVLMIYTNSPGHQRPSSSRQDRYQTSSSDSFRASSHCRSETSETGSPYCRGGPSCISHRAVEMRHTICVTSRD